MQRLLIMFSQQDRRTQIGFILVGIALAIAVYGGFSHSIWVLYGALFSIPVTGMLFLARGSMVHDYGQWNVPVIRERKKKKHE